MMLDVRVFRGEKLMSEDLALNDAVISKGSIAGWWSWTCWRTGPWSPR